MKAILYIAALLLFTSCSVLKKQKQVYKANSDSVAVNKVDSTATSRTDSVKHEEAVKETWWTKDTATSNEESSYTEKVTVITYDTAGRKQSETTKERKKEVKKKAENRQETGGEKVAFVDHAEIRKEDAVQVNRQDSTQVKKSEQAGSESKSRCSFPFVWLIVIGAAVYMLARRYLSLRI